MSISAIGVDICETDRISQLITRYGDRFLGKVYSAVEIEYCSSKVEDASVRSFAARFAAKEAFLKAMGTGLRGDFRWKDIEVRNDAQGKPYFVFYGKCVDILGKANVFLSLSHSGKDAIAFVVIERI